MTENGNKNPRIHNKRVKNESQTLHAICWSFDTFSCKVN